MFWLFIIMLIDTIGFGIILPILPVFALKMDLNSYHIGILTGIFSLFQLLTTPWLGWLSDKIGRKLIIVGSLFLLGISYIFTANATSFTVLLMARALSGAFTGSFPVALASVADLSTDKNRTKLMGLMGTAYGIGFILGPVIGGLLSGGELSTATFDLPFYIAAIFTLAAAVLSTIFYKETIKYKSTKNMHLITELRLLFKNGQILMYFIIFTFMLFAYSGLQTFLVLWGAKEFQLSPLSLGIIGTYFALFVAITQIIAPYLIKENPSILLGFSLAILAASLLLVYPKHLYLVVISISVFAIALGLLLPNINSKISVTARKQQQGFALGINQSGAILGQVLGPFILGIVYDYSIFYVFLIITLSLTCALLLSLKLILFKK